MSQSEHTADRAIADVRASIADLHAAAHEVRTAGRADIAELREFREEMRKGDDERATAARRGEMGADWQRVQRRIDLDQTSVAAVMQGADDTPEAVRLRRQSLKGASAIAAMQEDDLDDEDETNDVFGAVRREQAEIRALMQEIRELGGA